MRKPRTGSRGRAAVSMKRSSPYNSAAFMELMPAPGELTLDLGAGEGRVGRILRTFGHRVVEFEQSRRLAEGSPELPRGGGVLADVPRLPVRAGVADAAVAFMSFQDVDDMPSAVSEAARALRPGGTFVMAIV